jgi:hypothetical protein
MEEEKKKLFLAAVARVEEREEFLAILGRIKVLIIVGLAVAG